MNQALKSALLELKSEGVTLDPIADLDHILTLNTLAEKITKPPSICEAALLSPSMNAGGQVFFHLSIGARRFLIDEVFEWFEADYEMQDLAYAWAMAHTRCPELIWEMAGNKAGFTKSVKAWSKRISCSMAELKAAIASFQDAVSVQPEHKPSAGEYRSAMRLLDGWAPLPDGYKAEIETRLTRMAIEADKKEAYGELIETLLSEYGQTPEHWLWRVSSYDIRVLLAARTEKKEAEAREVHGIRDDRLIRAHHAFVTYKDSVRRLKQGTQ